MKTIYLLIAALFLGISFTNGQTPEAFTYQAVARDNNNQPISEQEIRVRFSIMPGNAGRLGTGNIAYQETHLVVTDAMGLFSLQIGHGQATLGDFSQIAWASQSFELMVEIDPQGGIQFEFMGKSTLLAVPYALHAKSADNVDDADADPTNELQHLRFNPDTKELEITNGNSVALPDILEKDGDPKNEIQDLSLTDLGKNVQIGIVGGPTSVVVDRNATNELQQLTIKPDPQNKENSLLTLTDGFFDGALGFVDVMLTIEDTDPENELQKLSKLGNQIKLNKNGGIIILQDDDPTNELQEFSITDNEIKLSQGGGTIKLLDNDPTNELQDLEIDDPGSTPGTVFIKVSGGNRTQAVDESSLNEIQELDAEEVAGPNGTETELTIRHRGQVTSFTKSLEDKVRIADTDPFNELQELDYNQETGELKLSGTNSVVIPRGSGGSDGDGDATNELQSLSFDIETGYLSISRKNRVQIPTSPWRLRQNGNLTYFEGSVEATALRLFNRLNVDEDATIGGRVTAKSLHAPTLFSNLMRTNSGYFKIEDTYYASDGQHAGTLIESIGSSSLRFMSNNVAGINMGSVPWPSGARPFFIVNTGRHSAGFTATADNRIQLSAQVIQCDEINAEVKNFRVDHPEDDTKEIWYASLEGPEAGAYERGTARLENGEAFIPFPEHYQLVANAETMTVNLTPLSAETFGLAVIEKTAEGIRVKELAGGTGTFSFDWEVTCVRKGYENFKVIRDK